VSINQQAELLECTIDGKTVRVNTGNQSAAPTSWSIDCYNPPIAGAVISILLKTHSLVDISVTDRTEGFESLPGYKFKPRPVFITPAPVGFGNAVFVTKRHHL
ncbi:MAG: hypothetical protein Q7U71_09665, partial [bacterium]|nr:hypothetical protein [bacterium]